MFRTTEVSRSPKTKDKKKKRSAICNHSRNYDGPKIEQGARVPYSSREAWKLLIGQSPCRESGQTEIKSAGKCTGPIVAMYSLHLSEFKRIRGDSIP